MSYIGPNELIFNNDSIQGIHSGGFSVQSIMMKKGISPIMTLNTNSTQKGGGNMVSDLFNDLVVPNWCISYNMGGGNHYKSYQSDSDSDKEELIDDDLHNKLLELIKEEDIEKNKQDKNKINQKGNTKKKYITKKGGTKRKNK